MKRSILAFITCVLATGVFSQNLKGDVRLHNIDWTEDSVEIITIDDIINEQQEVSSLNSDVNHFVDVWSRRGYFNFAYINSTLTPKEKIETGINNGIVSSFKSDWGISLQLGRSYRLHKKPIANTLQFNLDYTYIDLGINHFKAENGVYLYDSSNKKEITNDDGKNETYYYTPWNLEKYEANYSMSLGPSLTIMPFNYSNSTQLHYLRFNVYYHIGYNVSFLYMINDKDADKNLSKDSDYDNMSDNLKLDWGHGITNSIGFSLSWKTIGIGYEHLSRKLKYKSMNKKDFNNEKYQFQLSTNRFFIQIRM